eukprot:2823900-Amphidinium_carterae.1
MQPRSLGSDRVHTPMPWPGHHITSVLSLLQKGGPSAQLLRDDHAVRGAAVRGCSWAPRLPRTT